MFKRILAIAAMVFVLPALANAQTGSIETWAKSAGGNIITSLNGSPLTSAYGKRFANYTGHTPAPTVTVTANPGYNVSYDISSKGGTNACSGSGPVFNCGSGAGYVYATFTYGPQSANLHATAGAGGRVNIARIDNIYIGQTLLNPITFKFTPAAGYKVLGITLNGGALTGMTVNPAISAATVGQTVSVTFPAGYKFGAAATLAGTFSASASGPIAKTGAPQTVTPGASVTLDGSASLNSPAAYTWVQTGGPAVTLTANAAKATFTAPALAAGVTTATFYFKLTVTGGSSATTTVIVASSPAVAATSQCVNCHIANGVGAGVYEKWTASVHSGSDHSICSACHVGANTAAHPGTTPNPLCQNCHQNGVYGYSDHSNGGDCKVCHTIGNDPHTVNSFATINGTGLSAQLTICATCHSAEATKFTASAHWTPATNTEYSSWTNASTFDIFFNGTPGTAAGQLPLTTDPGVININANESWNTYEWNKTTGGTDGKGRPAAPVTCSNKCHFEAQKSYFKANPASTDPLLAVSGVQGCEACHSGGLLQGGAFKNGSSAHLTAVRTLSANTCEFCHFTTTGTSHGLSTAEFKSSKHWLNTYEYGSEFAGGAVAGQINPNQSWTTTEDGAATTCAYSCHFQPNLGPLGAVKADGTVAKDGKAVLRPGLDGCVNCHDPHKPTTTAAATCFECHSGSKHGVTTNGYKASKHYTTADGLAAFTPTDPALYNSSTFSIIKADCLACHNPHKPEQTTYNSGSLAGNSKIDVCTNCHNGNAAEGRKIGSVVHFASASTAATVAPSGLSYVGSAGRPVNSCTECHFNYNAHALTGSNARLTGAFTNNSAGQVLASWAQSGHGSLNAETWKADDHRFKTSGDRAGSTKGVTPANSKDNFCVHCHTAKGLVEFITASTGHAVFTNISSVGDRTNWDANPLVCSGCHAPSTPADTGVNHNATTTVVRTVPAAVGFYNFSTAAGNNLTKKIAVAHQYANYGTSNICMTCHVGASGSGEGIKLAFANNANFAGSFVNPHHGYAGATLGSYGSYEYGDYSNIHNDHADIGGSAAGPCVTCHYNGSDHSLAVIDVNGVATSPACTSCHGASFNVTAAKNSYNNSLVVLKNLLIAKGLPTARGTASWGTGDTGAKNMGAALNYFNLAGQATDSAAYVHNPNYAKKVIADTIDYLANGSITGNISAVFANPTYTAGLTADQIAGAQTTLAATHPAIGGNACTVCHGAAGNDPYAANCISCHTGVQNVSGFVNDNNGVRAIIPEFQKTSHHIYNGPTQLPTSEQCAICHLEGKVVAGKVVVDNSKHMVDKKIHLRDAYNDADHAWDPLATNPDHADMDLYCFNCHWSGGAQSNGVKAIQAVINAANAANPSAPLTPGTASAGNPFGDLLTNKYDQVTRSRVVDVWAAMQPGNASHHAVVKPKYKTRSTTTAIANGDMVTGQSTLFDGGLFVSDYTPLGASAIVADDSQLHCGDCHTVGQWKNDNTKYNQAAIGAHGSKNEYMLRNNLGTDALHDGTTYVCFNCHNDKAGVNTNGGYYAGFTNKGTSPTTGHMNGIHAGTNGCLQNTAGNVGNAIAATGRLGGNMFVNYTSKNRTLISKGGTQGNITGIGCTNCHNAGIKNGTAGQGYSNANNGFGGIHGGNDSYSDSNGGTQAPARFMSGMGNFKYIPPANTFNTTASGQPSTTKGANAAAGLGSCYTNAGTGDNAGYSSCNHHSTGTAIQRVGGTVGNVTRPLSY